jgi:hypothetical protein
MPRKQKIDLAEVLASINTTRPKCSCSIPPGKIMRVDAKKIQCPECGARFVPALTH